MQGKAEADRMIREQLYGWGKANHVQSAGGTRFSPTPGTRFARYASKLAVPSACAAPSAALPACALRRFPMLSSSSLAYHSDSRYLSWTQSISTRLRASP